MDKYTMRWGGIEYIVKVVYNDGKIEQKRFKGDIQEAKDFALRMEDSAKVLEVIMFENKVESRYIDFGGREYGIY